MVNVERLKRIYPMGIRVRLIHMNDPCPVPAEEFLSKHGSIIKTPNGYLQQVPQVSISQTNLKIMLKFCEQFGLTPSARNRLATMDAEVGNGDEMEDLLGGIL
ncbi:phage terminase, small subunit [Streptococcus agalactiae]|uniref:Phage terminase, small subunit n=1 Tax=Streptococcus agalactiae TaxID=1311 RepID=A0AB38VLF3_STRAG|nr:phage terminase, small subunit [Streptococcus agalactiae]